MAIYEVMTEDFWDAALGAFRPGLVWTLPAEGRGRILLGATEHYPRELAEYEAKLNEARGRGYSEREIWDYWANNGGNGYFSVRSKPYEVVAESQNEAVALLLRRCRGP